MNNSDIEAAWAYHDSTKHSYQSVRSSRHYLDWENQPLPFKIYSDLKPVPLAQPLGSSGVPALMAVSTYRVRPEDEVPLTSKILAEILFLSAGITKRRSYPGGEILFRAAACTGALYHIDLYIVCNDLGGLSAGVYHFSPQDFSLRQLRAGDYRAHVVRATAEEPSVVDAPCIVVCASTYWRNAWKYQARAYRHCYWDSGTILANCLAAAASRKVPANLIMGFIDQTIVQLLGLEPKREGQLALVALGHTPGLEGRSPLSLDPIVFDIPPLSKKEVDYAAIPEMHAASSLATEQEVAAWHGAAHAMSGSSDGELAAKLGSFELSPFDDADLPRNTLEEVVLRRGSTREFAREAISFAQLSTLLHHATCGIPADFLPAEGYSLNDIYLIAHAVDGIPSGAYYFQRQKRSLELLKEGDFRREAGYLGLGQEIPADSSVNVYFMADLNRILPVLGNRGYRAAQLEAAIMGGKLYLGAYAMRLGASGLTFFDDDVTEFFSPHAAGRSVMFLIALGKSARRKREKAD